MKHKVISIFIAFCFTQTSFAACFFVEYAFWQFDFKSGSTHLVIEVMLVCIPDYVSYLDEDEDAIPKGKLESEDERDERVLEGMDTCLRTVVKKAVEDCWDKEHDRPLPICDYPRTLHHKSVLADDMGDDMYAEHPIVVDGDEVDGAHYEEDGKIAIDVRRHIKMDDRDAKLFLLLIHERLHRWPWRGLSHEQEELFVVRKSEVIRDELINILKDYALCNVNWNLQKRRS